MAYQMTAARRRALRKAQLASARKRRGKGKGKLAAANRRATRNKRIALATGGLAGAAMAAGFYSNRKTIVSHAVANVAAGVVYRNTRKEGFTPKRSRAAAILVRRKFLGRPPYKKYSQTRKGRKK